MRYFENLRMGWVIEIVEIFGFINRQHICKKFGVTEQVASKDLATGHGDTVEDLLSEFQWQLDERRQVIDGLQAALEAMVQAVCGDTGFANAVRTDIGKAYPWPALGVAEALARAALSPPTQEEEAGK